MQQRRRVSVISVLSILTVLASWATPHATLAGWEGTEETVDGVLHINNPSAPMESPAVVELEEQWRLGGWDDDENIFGVISSIETDDSGNLYMMDAQLLEVRVYDKDGNFLRAIGRKGEGPGEFQNGTGMFRMPNGTIGVLQAFPSKIVMLTAEGDPAGDFPLPDAEGEGFRILNAARYAGDNLALIYMLNNPTQEDFTMKSCLSFISADGSTETLLKAVDSSMNFASPKIAESEWDVFRNRWTAFSDGRAASALNYNEYKIHFWGTDGKLDRVVSVDYKPHERSDSEMEEMLSLYKGFTKQIPIPNIQYDLDANHPPISGGGMYARDDGSLWVLTSRGTWGTDEGTLGVFDVFDAKGRYVHQITLKGEGVPREDGFFFVGDRLYVVTDWVEALMVLQSGSGSGDEEAEEEAEPMQVICYRLDGPQLGMK